MLPSKFGRLMWVAGLACSFLAGRAAAQLLRDTAPPPFVRAPMSASTRSVAIAVATNLHLAFDTTRLRTHTVWTGDRLRPGGYAVGGGTYIREISGTRLWGSSSGYPWSVGRPGTNMMMETPAGAGFKGASNKGGVTTLVYDVASNAGKSVRVHESARAETFGSVTGLVRRLEVAPCDQTLWLLAHAEMGRSVWTTNPAALIQREKNFLLAVARGVAGGWSVTDEDVAYEVEEITEASAASGIHKAPVTGHQTRAWLSIPSHSREVAVEVFSAICANTNEANQIISTGAAAPVAPARMKFLTSPKKDVAAPVPLTVSASGAPPPDGDEFYRIEHFPVPKELDLLVGGLDWLPNGDLAVCTWPGEVYVVEHAQGPLTNVVYRRFAGGFDEALGLKVIAGKIHVVQKPELTRLVDTDGDGAADLYESVNADWGFSGQLHNLAYGPAVDRDGNFYVTLDGNSAFYETPWRGWCVKISRDGKKLTGFGAGLRSPNGFVTYGPAGDIFCTDNEGHWIGTCKLNHLRAGKFFGYPSSQPWPKDEYQKAKTFEPPAVWFPRKLSPSAAGVCVITDERFGPFNGQLLVGDYFVSTIMRVALEQVDSEWQGAVWPFAKGFPSSVNRLSQGPDGKIYVGGCRRGWPTAAPRDGSLDRVAFTGRVPFEVRDVHARPDGFELVFTQPVDKAAAGDAGSYEVKQFGYKFHAIYGSPEIDHDGKENSASPVRVEGAAVSADGLRVKLKLSGWRAGYVTSVRSSATSAKGGCKLWHDTFYYTLNRIPK